MVGRIGTRLYAPIIRTHITYESLTVLCEGSSETTSAFGLAHMEPSSTQLVSYSDCDANSATRVLKGTGIFDVTRTEN